MSQWEQRLTLASWITLSTWSWIPCVCASSFCEKSCRCNNIWNGNNENSHLPTLDCNHIHRTHLLHATAACLVHLSYRLDVCPSIRPFVCLSVCLSHSAALSKRCMLWSQNLHFGLPQGFVIFHHRHEISSPWPWVKGFSSSEGIREGYP